MGFCWDNLCWEIDEKKSINIRKSHKLCRASTFCFTDQNWSITMLISKAHGNTCSLRLEIYGRRIDQFCTNQFYRRGFPFDLFTGISKEPDIIFTYLWHPGCPSLCNLHVPFPLSFIPCVKRNRTISCMEYIQFAVIAYIVDKKMCSCLIFPLISMYHFM